MKVKGFKQKDYKLKFKNEKVKGSLTVSLAQECNLYEIILKVESKKDDYFAEHNLTPIVSADCTWEEQRTRCALALLDAIEQNVQPREETYFWIDIDDKENNI